MIAKRVGTEELEIAFCRRARRLFLVFFRRFAYFGVRFRNFFDFFRD
jgi:hypothetical protein